MYTKKNCELIILDENPIILRYDIKDPDDHTSHKIPYVKNNTLVYTGFIDNSSWMLDICWNYITREIITYITDEFLVFNEYGHLKRKINVSYRNNHNYEHMLILSKLNIMFVSWSRNYCIHIDMYRCSDGSHISTMYTHCDKRNTSIFNWYMNESLNTLFVEINWKLVSYDFNV